MPRKTSDGSAKEFFPDKLTLPSLRDAAANCKACDLWKLGTQTVFGEGRRRATVMFVGEQPGNEEDLAGKPFVGPAGRLFNNALDEAGIARKLTSLMLSNILSGSRAANAASTKNLTPRKFLLAVPGSRRRSRWLSRR
jgi:uracil-DNA glycosylase